MALDKKNHSGVTDRLKYPTKPKSDIKNSLYEQSEVYKCVCGWPNPKPLQCLADTSLVQDQFGHQLDRLICKGQEPQRIDVAMDYQSQGDGSKYYLPINVGGHSYERQVPPTTS